MTSNDSTNSIFKYVMPIILTASNINLSDISYNLQYKEYSNIASNESNCDITNSLNTIHISDEEKFILLKDFTENLAQNSIELEYEFSKILSEHFDELL